MQHPSHSLESQLRRSQASVTYEEKKTILDLTIVIYGHVDLGMNLFMANGGGISSE